MADILSTREAGKILGIDPASVSKQINNGKMQAKKFGNSWMITLEEVERYKREVQDVAKNKPKEKKQSVTELIAKVIEVKD